MSGRDSLRPIEGARRGWRSRLSLQAEFALALLPTATVLAVFAFVEVLSTQPLLFASLASSAFLIYLDPQHGTNATRTLVLAQMSAAVLGFLCFMVWGPGYAAGGVAMVALITLMIVTDAVHPPAVSTSLSFAFRSGDVSNLLLFGLAVLLVCVLVGLQRSASWALSRLSDPHSIERGWLSHTSRLDKQGEAGPFDGQGLAIRLCMLAYFDVPLSWGELLKRTLRETRADNGLGLAAQLAYYFFLALFPALLLLLALTSFLPAQDVVGRVVGLLQGVAPQQVLDIVRDQLTKIADARQGGLLSFGIIAALWSSSAAMVAIIDALNRAYDVEDQRPWWKQRLTAILLTFGVALFILVAFALVIAGPEMAEFVASRVGLGNLFASTWKILQWPVVFALVATAVGLIYHFAPDVDQDFAWITPGSLLACLLWVAASLAFRVYVMNFGSYNETYGAIGGVMVLMLWLYLSGLVILVGAEMNAEIEHASPHGKAVGERVAGQRRSIGARAAREFRQGQRRPAPSTQRPVVPVARRPRWSPAGVVVARTLAIAAGAFYALTGRRVRQ